METKLMNIIDTMIKQAGCSTSFEGGIIDQSFKSTDGEWEMCWSYKMASNPYDIAEMPVRVRVSFKFLGVVCYTYGIVDKEELSAFVERCLVWENEIRLYQFQIESEASKVGEHKLISNQ